MVSAFYIIYMYEVRLIFLNYRIAQNFNGGKSDEIWQINHVKKFDK